MSYGVLPTGFNRKPLSVILGEIESSLVTEFGPDVVQTPQSPLGQLNGVMADIITELWEFGQEVYQSYDVDQAEGTRLEILAKLRLLRRAFNETDAEFRSAITNQGRARIDIQDIVRAIRSVPGVTYAQIFINDSNIVDTNLLEPGTVCAAVLGGEDAAIADELRRFIVPGISTYGNTYVSTAVDGYCRSLAILRPILVPVTLTVTVRARRDVFGCPPPSPTAIRDGLLLDLSLINGDDITYFRIRSAIEARFSNVEVLTINGRRDGIVQGDNQPVDIAFIELATLTAPNITVNAV